MRLRAGDCALALVALVLVSPCVRGQEVTDEQIDAAIEGGVQALLKSQNVQGGWGDYPPGTPPPNANVFRHGFDVCGLMGLAYGDIDVKDERFKKAFQLVLEANVERNYVYAVRVIALCKLYPRLRPEQKELAKKRLMADVEWLFKAQASTGGWDYYGTGDGELSNTQMALLALWEATNVLRELPTDVWEKALKRYLKWQKADGGWNYGADDPVHRDMATYGSMTAAAVASLFVIREKLCPGTGCPCRNGRSLRKGREAEIDAAIERGIEWLKKNFVTDTNPGRGGSCEFWFFSSERVGLASGLKYFGTHNWYAEMAKELVNNRNRDSGWGYPSETALAIAFLAKGRAPILFNKLQFKGAWNNHPRDIATLARYVGKIKEQPIQWQVVNLDVPVEELHDAPILYISAEAALDLPEEHKKKLRQFTDTGGTVLFEASCGNYEAATWWEKTCKEVWPEWELKLVDREHPLWTADQQIKGRLPALFGASDGVRTFLFYSKVDISCPWNTEAVAGNRALFDLGCNLYMYTTDRGKLRSRLARRETGAGKKYAGQALKGGDKTTLTVARVKHGGEWYLAGNYHPWSLLAADLKQKAEVTLEERDPVPVGAEVPAGTSLLYYCGRAGSELGPDGAKWLKSYLTAGGFVFAEAVLGDQRFESALKDLTDAGLATRPLGADHPLVTGLLGSATGCNASKVAYTYSLAGERVGKPEPLLVGLFDGEKLVGLFSPFDIMYAQMGCKAFGSRGYAAEDARALATNLALYLTSR